jgi:hypothetical protein
VGSSKVIAMARRDSHPLALAIDIGSSSTATVGRTNATLMYLFSAKWRDFYSQLAAPSLRKKNSLALTARFTSAGL